MVQTAIDFFTTNKVSLVGVLTRPEGVDGSVPAAVVCHPHPLLQGSKSHSMVVSIARVAASYGIATLRFDFRGVGDSQGDFTNGQKEQEDVRSALNILKVLDGIEKNKVALVGYSFGASVILDGLRWYKPAKSLVFIGPSMSFSRFAKCTRQVPTCC